MRALETNQQTDERLLIEAAQRDPIRFAELYELNFDRVYAYIASRVRDRDVAEDLTAEVFQQALANLGRLLVRVQAIPYLVIRPGGVPDTGCSFAVTLRGDVAHRRVFRP